MLQPLKRAHLNPSPDQLIFHYCDANALLSILQGKSLRYTHAAYLNDSKEIIHGIQICRNFICKQRQAAKDDPVLTATLSYLDNAEKWQYYVCCFSGDGDKLSQWRAYANNGDGFAIGFNARGFLASGFGPLEPSLGPVLYADEALEPTLSSLLDRYKTSDHRFSNEATPLAKQFSYEMTAASIGNALIDEAVFIKSSDFREEQEWRVVRSYKLEGSDTELCFLEMESPPEIVATFRNLREEFLSNRQVRAGRYGLTPYIEIDFPQDSIREIVCGPRTTADLTEASLEILKKKYGFSYKVSRSVATYR